MSSIKYIANDKGYTERSEWDPNEDYGNDYVRVYFRIDAKHYYYPFEGYEGYDADKMAFEQEVQNLFQSLGWTLTLPKYSNSCYTAQCGDCDLYLHPQHFSGKVLKNEVKRIAEVLNQAKTFKLRWVDLYETAYAMTDAEYEAYLETQTTLIRQNVFDLAQTKRRTKFKCTDEIVRIVANQVRLHRVAVENGRNSAVTQAEHYIEQVMHQMVIEGYLVIPASNDFAYVRSLNKTEQKSMRLTLI